MQRREGVKNLKRSGLMINKVHRDKLHIICRICDACNSVKLKRVLKLSRNPVKECNPY